MKKANIKHKVERALKKRRDPNRIIEKAKSDFSSLPLTDIKKYIDTFKLHEDRINLYLLGQEKTLPLNLAKTGITYYLFKLKNLKNPVRHHDPRDMNETIIKIKEYTENIKKLQKLL